jgi:hypothetical protein
VWSWLVASRVSNILVWVNFIGYQQQVVVLQGVLEQLFLLGGVRTFHSVPHRARFRWHPHCQAVAFVDNVLGKKVNFHTEVFVALHWCHQISVFNFDGHEFGIVGGDDTVEG